MKITFSHSLPAHTHALALLSNERPGHAHLPFCQTHACTYRHSAGQLHLINGLSASQTRRGGKKAGCVNVREKRVCNLIRASEMRLLPAEDAPLVSQSAFRAVKRLRANQRGLAGAFYPIWHWKSETNSLCRKVTQHLKDSAATRTDVGLSPD